MKFSVHYDSGSWVFEIYEAVGDDAPTDTFELDAFDDALEAVTDLLEDVRSVEDPLADLFDEDDR